MERKKTGTNSTEAVTVIPTLKEEMYRKKMMMMKKKQIIPRHRSQAGLLPNLKNNSSEIEKKQQQSSFRGHRSGSESGDVSLLPPSLDDQGFHWFFNNTTEAPSTANSAFEQRGYTLRLVRTAPGTRRNTSETPNLPFASVDNSLARLTRSENHKKRYLYSALNSDNPLATSNSAPTLPSPLASPAYQQSEEFLREKKAQEDKEAAYRKELEQSFLSLEQRLGQLQQGKYGREAITDVGSTQKSESASNTARDTARRTLKERKNSILGGTPRWMKEDEIHGEIYIPTHKKLEAKLDKFRQDSEMKKELFVRVETARKKEIEKLRRRKRNSEKLLDLSRKAQSCGGLPAAGRAGLVKNLVGTIEGNAIAASMFDLNTKRAMGHQQLAKEGRKIKATQKRKKQLDDKQQAFQDQLMASMEQRNMRLQRKDLYRRMGQKWLRLCAVAVYMQNLQSRTQAKKTEKRQALMRHMASARIAVAFRRFIYNKKKAQVTKAVGLLGAIFVLKTRKWQLARRVKSVEIILDFLHSLKKMETTCGPLRLLATRVMGNKSFRKRAIRVQRFYRRKIQVVQAHLELALLQWAEKDAEIRQERIKKTMAQQKEKFEEDMKAAQERAGKFNKPRKVVTTQDSKPKDMEQLFKEDIEASPDVPLDLKSALLRSFLRHKRLVYAERKERFRAEMSKLIASKRRQRGRPQTLVLEATNRLMAARRSSFLNILDNQQLVASNANSPSSSCRRKLLPQEPVFHFLLNEEELAALMKAGQYYMDLVYSYSRKKGSSGIHGGTQNVKTLLGTMPNLEDMGREVAARLHDKDNDYDVISGIETESFAMV